MALPLMVVCTRPGKETVTLRPAFLSRYAQEMYPGYALNQFKKPQADLRQRGAPRWNHVRYLLRLLLSAEQLLSTGELRLAPTSTATGGWPLRRGDLPWEEVEGWRLALPARLDPAVERTPLPSTARTASTARCGPCRRVAAPGAVT